MVLTVLAIVVAATFVVTGLTYRPLGLAAAIGPAALLVGAMITRVRAARRHDRSEAAGVAVDLVTFALAASTAAVFALNL